MEGSQKNPLLSVNEFTGQIDTFFSTKAVINLLCGHFLLLTFINGANINVSFINCVISTIIQFFLI